MNFKTDHFIVEIQRREAIWNCKGAVYKNKLLKCKQWEELVDIFGKENMKAAERKNVRKELQKKWRNIRDNFVKTLRGTTSGAGAKKKTQYIYFNNLMFLKDTVSINETDSNAQRQDDSNTEEDNELVERPLPKQDKKIKKEDRTDVLTDEADDIGINVINKNVEFINVEEDEDRLFCLSLVNEIKKVPEHLRLRTKAQLLQVITEAQTSRYCKSTRKRKS